MRGGERMKNRRSLSKAIALSGYSHTRLHQIFRAAGEQPCRCDLRTFKRVIRAHQNKPHGCCVLVEIDGQALTVEQWAARANTDPRTVRMRALRNGWSLERAVRESIARPGRWSQNLGRRCLIVTLDGESLSTREWAARAGVPKHVLFARRAAYGWTIEQTIRESIARPGVWKRGRKSALVRAAVSR